MSKPRNPETLSHAELSRIVTRLQRAMFKTPAGWDEDNDVNGGDLVEEVGRLLNQFGLVPGQKPTSN